MQTRVEAARGDGGCFRLGNGMQRMRRSYQGFAIVPYAHKLCTKCGHDAGERYHNVVKCPACGEVALIAATRFEHQGPACCREENRLLREEVNALHVQSGKPSKYEIGVVRSRN